MKSLKLFLNPAQNNELVRRVTGLLPDCCRIAVSMIGGAGREAQSDMRQALSKMAFLAVALPGMLLLPRQALGAFFGGTNPNVLILLDTSGSMTDSVTALPQYSNSTTYSIGPGFTTGAVYQQTGSGTSFGNFSVYANSAAGVGSSTATAALNNNGFFVGNIGNVPITLFLGNYLNYENCSSCQTSQVKGTIAKRIINNLVSNNTNVRWGLEIFDPNDQGGSNPCVGSSDPCAGKIIQPIGTDTGTMVAAINGLSFGGWTPTGEALQTSDSYFKGAWKNVGTSTIFSSPILAQCQVNMILLVSDGAWNGVPDPATIATTLFTTDHDNPTSLFAGLQNIIVNSVGLALNDPTIPFDGNASLKQVAANGGGTYYLASDTPQLEQALSGLPPFITLNAPTNFSVVSGTAVPMSATVGNTTCVSSVQFTVDGNGAGFPLTGAQTLYSMKWNSNSVANGTHTVAAEAFDLTGNPAFSPPALILTNNTKPVISNVSVSVGQSTATITWTTDQASDTQVKYGTTSAYGFTTPLNSSLVTSHSVALSALTPGTIYHFSAFSNNSTGGSAVFGDSQFTTQGVPVVAGPLDHFQITFLNNGVSQTGPGSSIGGRPYALFAGDCFATTIEGLDASGLHVNFSGNVILSQFLINAAGAITALAPGINVNNASKTNNAELGISSMTLTMTNGFAFLGSATDVTTRLCFYRSTRAPGDAKTAGALGDMELQVVQAANPAVIGVSASYVGWHGNPTQIVALAPTEALAPATPTGSSGTLVNESQGTPFFVQAYLTDPYFNAILNSNDTLRFTSSMSTSTSFNPSQGSVASGGVFSSSATVDACNTTITLTADDATSSLVATGQVAVNLVGCSGVSGTSLQKGFFELAVPTATAADQLFTTTITVRNVFIPLGTGNVLYSANLVPMVQVDATHFAPASGAFTIPTVQFSIPETTSGTFTFNIFNQGYQTAGTVWMQLVAVNPPELAGASVLAGPIQVAPAAPAKIVLSPIPTMGPFQSATLTATLTDIFGNGISSQTLEIQLGQLPTNCAGNPCGFSTSIPGCSALQCMLTTNSSGQVQFTYLSGGASEQNSFSVFAPSLPNVPSVPVSFLTTLLGNLTVAAYPSPVNISQRPLTIEYSLGQDSDVTMTITDLFGQEVWKNSFFGSKGFNKLTWDGKNGRGTMVATGAYVLHMEVFAYGQRVTTAKYKFGLKK